MSTDVPQNTLINDVRLDTFRGTTFSNYKLTEVRKHFILSMSNGKLEPACYWCAELICSGHYPELWECIFYFMGKHIHIANPKIPIYLEKRYEIFRNIMNQKYFNYELDLRNNDTIRTLFAEIVTIMTLSPKKPSFETLKIDREEEFDMTVMKERLKAENTDYGQTIFEKDDPKEFFIAINEFAHHTFGKIANMQEACYWIEWMIEFDIICRKRKQKCTCKRRDVAVDHKHQCDSVWLLWDTLLIFCGESQQKKHLLPVLKSLMNLFCVKYSTGTPKKRKYFLYFAVELMTENANLAVDLVQNKQTLQIVVKKIHDIYKQIKQNEIAPNTEYLFKDVDKNNSLDSSIQKLKVIESMDFVPRT